MVQRQTIFSDAMGSYEDPCLRQSDLRGLTECLLLYELSVLRYQHVQFLLWSHVYSR